MQVKKNNRSKFRLGVILLLYKHINEDITQMGMQSEIYDQAIKVINKIPKLDAIINSSLVKYSISRLHALDLSIIRYATYEMLFDKLHPSIVIDEAVEITKIYCDLDDGKQHQFTNAVLDKIKDKLYAQC